MGMSWRQGRDTTTVSDKKAKWGKGGRLNDIQSHEPEESQSRVPHSTQVPESPLGRRRGKTRQKDVFFRHWVAGSIAVLEASEFGWSQWAQ